MNKRDIERLTYSGHDKDYSLGKGLYVKVRKTSKTWVFRTKVGGKTRIKTIGKFPAMSISEALAAAIELKRTAGEVNDIVTMSIYIDTYYKDSVLGSHNKYKKPHKRPEQALRYLNIIRDKFGLKRLDNITKGELSSFIREYSRRGARTGDVMRVHLSSLFADAFECGKVSSNPMAGITSKASGYAPVSRNRVLSDAEILLLFKSEHQNARVLRFLLLTGLRISEAQQGYVDGDVFRVDDSKNGKPHWAYLTELARKQLPLPVCTPTNIQAWLKRWLIREDIEPRFTPHDLRRTFNTRLNDTGVEPYIVEKLLNHSLEGVMAVYNKAEYTQQRFDATKKMEQLVLDVVGDGDA